MSSDELLIAQICFDEALENAADRLSSASFPPPSDLINSEGTFEKWIMSCPTRMKEWRDGRRVDFTAITKRLMKEDFPELTFDCKDGACIWFGKTYTSDYQLCLGFERAFPLSGKAFTLKIQLRRTIPTRGNNWTESFFRILRWESESAWAYTGKDSAEEAVRDAVHLARYAWKDLERAIARMFSPWPLALPSEIERRGQPTARDCLPIADKFAQSRCHDPVLFRISDGVRSLAYRDASGPQLTWDGRLTLNNNWCFSYFAPSGETFSIFVPEAGRPWRVDQTGRYSDGNASRYKIPIAAGWIDSSDAFGIASDYARKESVTEAVTSGITCRLDGIGKPNFLGQFVEQPIGNPLWQIVFMARERHLHLAIDACRGRLIQVG